MGLLMTGCWRPSISTSAVEVDVLEDELAHVVSRSTGAAQDVARSALPANVREGDVVVDGRIDPVLTAELRTDVHRAREKLRTIPASGHVDLDALPASADPDPQAGEPSSTR